MVVMVVVVVCVCARARARVCVCVCVCLGGMLLFVLFCFVVGISPLCDNCVNIDMCFVVAFCCLFIPSLVRAQIHARLLFIFNTLQAKA